jgi:hypothetical protein
VWSNRAWPSNDQAKERRLCNSMRRMESIVHARVHTSHLPSCRLTHMRTVICLNLVMLNIADRHRP